MSSCQRSAGWDAGQSLALKWTAISVCSGHQWRGSSAFACTCLWLKGCGVSWCCRAAVSACSNGAGMAVSVLLKTRHAAERAQCRPLGGAESLYKGLAGLAKALGLVRTVAGMQPSGSHTQAAYKPAHKP